MIIPQVRTGRHVGYKLYRRRIGVHKLAQAFKVLFPMKQCFKA